MTQPPSSTVNTVQEFSLMFLPQLTSLAVSDVDLDIIVNIATFCPQLLSLSISQSEVTRYPASCCLLLASCCLLLTSIVRQVSDEAAATLCRLRLLRRLHLDQVRTISAYG